jgi:hypothetical protein
VEVEEKAGHRGGGAGRETERGVWRCREDDSRGVAVGLLERWPVKRRELGPAWDDIERGGLAKSEYSVGPDDKSRAESNAASDGGEMGEVSWRAYPRKELAAGSTLPLREKEPRRAPALLSESVSSGTRE